MKQLLIVLSTVLLLSFMTFPCMAQQDVIYACYQKNNGQLRIVENANECRKSEIATSLNTGQARNAAQIALLKWYEANTVTSFPTGAGPTGIAFDGANIYVANGSSNTITKLRASDGALLGTFSTGHNPLGLAFDGANIWVGNVGDNTVWKIRASDGAPIESFSLGYSVFGTMAFDGSSIWVTNWPDGTVSKF